MTVYNVDANKSMPHKPHNGVNQVNFKSLNRRMPIANLTCLLEKYTRKINEVMKTKRFVHIDLIGYVKHKKPFFLRIFLTKLPAKFFELFYHFILINFKYVSRGCGNS